MFRPHPKFFKENSFPSQYDFQVFDRVLREVIQTASRSVQPYVQCVSWEWKQGRSQKFILGGYNFLLHDTTILCTSSLTTLAAISAQNNFQGLILGGYIYRYTPPSLPPEWKNGWYRQSCLCIQVQQQLSEQFMVTVAVLK